METTMVLKPRLSEKTYALSTEKNVYVFVVPKDASKQAIAKAVESQFKVTVEKVNIALIKGKAKRTVRKGGRPIAGRQNDRRKAYVTVKSGDQIPIFAAIEEAEKAQEKVEKAAQKAAKKEKK